MNKFFQTLHKYLLYSFPFVLLLMVWGSFQDQESFQAQGVFFYYLYEILAWNLMLWFALLLVALLFLVFHSDFRHMTLRRVANLKEEDEREEEITGRAAKSSYVATMGVLIFLLFLSIFQFNVQKLAPEKAVDGKTKTINIGMKFNLFEESVKQEKEDEDIIVQSTDVPLTKTGILILLLLWQWVTYNFQIRKEMNPE